MSQQMLIFSPQELHNILTKVWMHGKEFHYDLPLDNIPREAFREVVEIVKEEVEKDVRPH